MPGPEIFIDNINGPTLTVLSNDTLSSASIGYSNDGNLLIAGAIPKSASVSILSDSSSYSQLARSASRAISSESSSYAATSGTASYFSGNSISSSFSTTASYALNAGTASYVLNAISASYVLSSSYSITSSYSNNSNTASFALNFNPLATASYALRSLSASYSDTSSYALRALSSSYAVTSSYSDTCSYALNVEKFGQSFKFEQDTASSTTNATTFQNKITLNTGLVQSGTYHIAWSQQQSISKINEQMIYRITLDSVTIAEQTSSAWKADAFYGHAGILDPALSEATHSITMDYCSSNTGASTTIKNAAIEFWRAK